MEEYMNDIQEILDAPGMDAFNFQWFVIIRYLLWLEKHPEKDTHGLLNMICKMTR